MNILILSCGSRNKIVQYFKNGLKGKGLVVATDCSRFAPALYEADRYFIVPRVDDKRYLDIILNICRENKINAVLSLIDPELTLLADHKQDFLDIGTMPIISDSRTVELCFDKYAMYEFLTGNGFRTARSYIDKEAFFKDLDIGVIGFPVFVKPVKGSASININKVASRDEIEMLFGKFNNLMIQEFMDGTEYGADVYIDVISGEPVSIFTKEKILMRAGETDKAVSRKDETLFDLIKSFVKKTGLKGIIDIDIFKIDGEYYISEVNPRFGGGYPHGHELGVDVPHMIVENLEGRANDDVIGNYEEGFYMMKFNEVKVMKLGDDANENYSAQ